MAATSRRPGEEGPPSSSPDPGIDLRNPKPLSATQEAEVRDLYYKRVRRICAKEIKEFAECATNRTITATWVCRKQRLAMNSCMIAHATHEEEDRAREEWFATRPERRRAREREEREMEKRKKQVMDMMKEDEDRRKAQSSSWNWWWKGSSGS